MLALRPAVVNARLRALGTYVDLAVTQPAALGPARQLLMDHLRVVDAACSRFRPDSELMWVQRAGGSTVDVSPTLAGAVAVALRAAALTDGDVDPTVGSAMRAIGYDRDFAEIVSGGSAVQVVHVATDAWRQIELDLPRCRLRVPAGVSLDLGATAKAWAADRAALEIASSVGCGVLVNLGGDISVAGQAPAGGWVVDIDDGAPASAGDAAARVAIFDGGLATSSTTARRWQRGGSVLHHIVDPRTGTSAVSPWRTVSVVAASCADANIASTASIIRGAAAPGWLASLHLPSRLVDEFGEARAIGDWPVSP